MKSPTSETEIHIPDEALHLRSDRQFQKALESHGHKVRTGRHFAVATHKDSGVTVAWQPREDNEPHPMSYTAQLIRTLVRLGFFVALIVLAALHLAGIF